MCECRILMTLGNFLDLVLVFFLRGNRFISVMLYIFLKSIQSMDTLHKSPEHVVKMP